ncbi:MAG: NUDIX domain-containing protein [Halanaerobium sp.]|nr:NUDIX domain-containing protein [Halanaerobium sp.]
MDYNLLIDEDDNTNEYRSRQGVFGVIFSQDHYIALLSTGSGYTLPGGNLMDNEGKKDCLQRIIKEETGWTVVLTNYIGKGIDYFYAKNKKNYIKRTGFFFEVLLKDKVSSNGKQFIWFPPEEVLDKLDYAHQRWAIKKVLKEKGYEIDPKR